MTAVNKPAAGVVFHPGEFNPTPPLSNIRLDLTGRAQEMGQLKIDVPPEALKEVIALKQHAVTQVFRTLDQVHKDLGGFLIKLSDVMAGTLDGEVLNPDGSPGAGLSIEALAPKYTTEEINADPKLAKLAWAQPRTLTNARGAFKLSLPTVPVPSNGLTLQLRGAQAMQQIDIKRVLLLDGRLGSLALDKPMAPLSQSVIAQLKDVAGDAANVAQSQVDDHPEQFADVPKPIALGDCEDCARSFRSGSGVIDRFQYSVLVRLVEPQMNQWQPLYRVRVGDRNYVPFALPHTSDSFWNSTGAANAISQLNSLGSLVLVNRMPIDRPIDVSQFHDAIEKHPVFLPKASTLGLGYMVHMQQTWVPSGLSLGDLVYSLPLAPGEQQRIAIEERVQTASQREVESYSEDEFQTFRETQDASAMAVFRSAYDEAVDGGSTMRSSSHTASVAAEASTGIIGAIFGGGGVSGGYSSSSSSGSTSSWQNTSRDFASNAAQQMHSSLGRVAAASRRSNRTSIRVATATERTQVTTRVVSNHNKAHALTMQWWEVLRHFAVSSEVNDVQMVCFVPLELVQFLPEGHPFSLDAMPGSRQQLLARWGMVIRYLDVLAPFFARHADFNFGIRQLRNFAANPEVVPNTSPLQMEPINVTLTGSFMPFEEVFVTVVGRTGARLGPVKMTAPSPLNTVDLTPERFSSREEFLGYLKDRRLHATNGQLTASIPLPDWFARSDVVRLDVSRRFTSLSYRMKAPAFNFTASVLGELTGLMQAMAALTVSLSPSDLEAQLGGPVLGNASAVLPGNVNLLSSASFSAGDQMPGQISLPTLRVSQLLGFGDLLRIEAVFHHIVRNTVFYSKAVWAALSDEERAILLERFTIGVPAGGVTSADQEVPLLNCVANRVLGFFGNAAIMPFAIPPQVAADMQVTSRDIQDGLLRFHRQAFQPTRSSITLPTRGTLGEAVLGSCSSAEKIDLTRFWNWQDSPGDTADAIPPSAFTPAQPLSLGGSTGGGAGGSGGSGAGGGSGSSGSIISINSPAASSPSTALLEALIAKAPDLAKELNLTGLETLQKQISADTTSAAAGRKEAIDSVTQIQLQAMKSAESVVKSVAEVAGKVLAPVPTPSPGPAPGPAPAPGP